MQELSSHLLAECTGGIRVPMQELGEAGGRALTRRSAASCAFNCLHAGGAGVMGQLAGQKARVLLMGLFCSFLIFFPSRDFES
jgi:hypothetical protein